MNTDRSFLLTTKLSKELKKEKERRNISWEAVITQSIKKGKDSAIKTEIEDRDLTGNYLGDQFVSIDDELENDLKPAIENSQLTLGEAARISIAKGVKDLKNQRMRTSKI